MPLAPFRFFLLLTLLQVLALPEALPTLSPVEEGILAEIDTLWARGERESSLAVTDSFLLALDRESQPIFAAQLLRRLGKRRRFLGDPVAAESHLREGLDLALDQADSALACEFVLKLSVAIEQQGRSADAQESYGNLLELAKACGDEKYEGWACVGLAWHATLQGRADEPVELYTRASELFRRCGDVGGEVWAQNGLGNALAGAGAYREALDYFRRAVALGQGHDRPWVAASPLNNLGSIEYCLGNRGAALEAFERAYEIHRGEGGARGSITPSINIALCHSDLGRYDEAEKILDRTLRDCREHGFRDLEAAAMVHRARLDHERGRFGEASRRFRDVLARREMLSVGTRIEALMGLSRALVGLDSLDSALAVLESGYGLVQNEGVQEKLALFGIHMGETLTRLGRDEEAIEHFLSAERQAEHSERINYRIWALTLAARTYLDQGEPERALDLLIKASGLWETLRQLPFEPEWRERWSEAARRLYTNLAACLLEIRAEPETDRTRQAFDRMQAFKARTLQERMLGPGEDLTTFAAQRNLELTTLEQLQRSVLQPGELFLDFYLGPDTSFVFAVNCQECRVAGLRNGGDMGETLRRYHSILSGSGGDGVSERAAKTLEDIAGRVPQVILGDVWDLVQDSDRIFVSPDGALHLVPFAYLGADVRDDPAREWIRVPSATILTWLRDGTRSNEYVSGPTILAVAGSGEKSGRSLPGAVKEVRDLGRRYRDVHVHVSDSRETATDIDVLSGPDVIHIATHLAMDDQNPWQSTIRSIRGHRDEAIRTGEIASMELSARLAVLSSCESAGGRVLSGEGVLGLSSAFLSAGVPAVVASLWPVSDRATARFMEHFYRAIADGKNVVTALDASRQAMRADTETRHPFYWAGFVIIGDGDVKVPLTMRRRFPWFVVLGILPLVGGAGFLIRRQRFNQRRS